MRLTIAVLFAFIQICFGQVNYVDTAYVRLVTNSRGYIDTTSLNSATFQIVNLDSMKTVPVLGWATQWRMRMPDNSYYTVNKDLRKIDTLLIIAGRHYASSMYKIYVYNVRGKFGNILDSADCMYFTDNTFPVELSSFTVQQRGQKINLYWRTETEVNNYGFDVERRFTYKNEWETIGFVKGNGNSNSPKNYSFTDDIISGNNTEIIYRLKQIDTDGKFEYSDEKIIVYKAVIKDFSLSIYPNPFNPSTVVEFEIPYKSDVALVVYNIVGEEIKNISFSKISGKYQVAVNLNEYASGVYLFVIKGDNFIVIKKGMLVK